MSVLFADIGNTNISYLWNGKTAVIGTHNLYDLDFAYRFFGSFNTLNSVIIASVVPKIDDIIGQILQALKVKFYSLKISDINIKINIENPAELGMDRAINAQLALQKFGGNIIIIDFGTALTFDIVHNGSYEGGMIFPGLAMAMHNLHTKTAKLPDVKIEEYCIGIGKNTVSAIQNSACIGYTGVIRQHIEFISTFYKTNFVIIFTGGSGKLFSHTIQNAIFVENLILEYLVNFNNTCTTT